MAYIMVYVKVIKEYHVASDVFSDQIGIGDEVLLKFFRNTQMLQFKCMILHKGSKEACESRANERNSTKNIVTKHIVCEKISKIDQPLKVKLIII
jgi:hypothetical protein